MSLLRSAAQSAGVAYHRAGEIANVVGGLWQFYTQGDVSAEARRAVLKLHCRTNGRSTDRLALLLRSVRPPRRPAPVSGALGDLSLEAQRAIVRSLARDGYYVFDHCVPEEICGEIERFAAQTPAWVEGRGDTPVERVVFDPRAPISKTYRLAEEATVADRAVQTLMADPSILAIAEAYLATHPILAQVNVWWSAAYGDTPGADAAQEFHFDFDPPPVWLLFFVYLTDVGPENGPHVFVRGSHVAGHPAAGPLRKRGYVRIPDADIDAAFGTDSTVELVGRRGTILAVDTRGFHKGKMLTAGHRLMLQLTYACPPFSGAHARRRALPTEIDPALARAMAATPRVFERYR